MFTSPSVTRDHSMSVCKQLRSSCHVRYNKTLNGELTGALGLITTLGLRGFPGLDGVPGPPVGDREPVGG